ncbi:MAG: response regulator [Lewinellaceae bacterium]|nr:response regulator [Lewinellaceae bacterium]
METTGSRNWEQRFTRLLYYPGDDEETMLSKRVWIGLAFTAFALGAILLLICLVNRFHALTLLTAVFTVFFLVCILLFFRVKRQIQLFFYVSEIFKVLYSFGAVVITGGIIQSGGLVFVGMAGIFFALVFPEPEKVWFLLLLYLSTLATEVLLQPYLVPLVRFSSFQNLLFFVLTLTGAVLSLFFFIRTFIKERARFRKLETEKLRALDAAKSHFFTNISHEFRTPLTVILGMSDELREEPGRLIKRNSKKLLRLVDQLLDLSKLEAGTIPTQYAQVDVVMELKYLLESFHSMAEGKRIKLQFSSDPEALWMDIDPEKMENIIGNLIDNAIKYTPEGGEVRVHLKILPGERLLVRVEDTGIGIPLQYQEQVFSRFFRVGEWPVEGAGIGLAIVREYVKLLDGQIEMTSRQGEGTTFSLYFPIRQNAPRKTKAPLPEEQETGASLSQEGRDESQAQLLIIEDNTDVVHYLKNFLRGKYQLSVAHDGAEGITLALEEVPDIIISDIMMPKKDGVEVCQTLKNDIRTNHIPIILLTAKADTASRIAGLEAGADAYLAKPFNRQELEVELAKLLRIRELLREKYRQPVPPETNGPPPGLNERFLHDLRQCLERHYQEEEFGIKALHTLLDMSSTQLHRKLTALTGMPASHYMRSFRLEKARELLRTTRMTIADVAFAVGFRDPLYFSRAFSQQYGLSPSEDRG